MKTPQQEILSKVEKTEGKRFFLLKKKEKKRKEMESI